MALTLIITDAGRQALVNAARDGTNAVRIASCGVSSAPTVPVVTATVLPGEIKRVATLSGDAVSANVIHLVVRDESADSYTLRSFGLYLQDGTLFAIYGQADPILEKSSQALLLLAVDAAFVDISAAQVTFGNANFLNPPATVDRPGVIELATDAEAAALTDALRALTPKGMAAIFTAANILSRLLQIDGAGSGLDADLLDGRQGAEFALLTGASYTGALSAPSIAATGPNGARVASASPLLSFYNAAQSDRLGYFQHAGANGDLSIVNDQGGVVKITTGGSTTLLVGPSGVNVVNALTVQGETPSYQFYNAARTTRYGYLTHSGNGGDLSIINDQGGVVKFTTGGSTTLLVGPSGVSAVRSIAVQGTSPSFEFYSADRAIRYGYLTQSSGGELSVINDQGGTITLRTGGANVLTVGPAGVTIGGVFAVTGTVSSNGHVVWHPGNDGAGSGLDADLLDGRQASEFALLTGAAYSGNVSMPRVTGTGPEGLRAAAASPLLGFYNAAQSTRFGYIQHAGTNGAISVVNEQGAPINLSTGGKDVLVVGPSGAYVDGVLAQAGGGKYLHHADADIAGDTITRGTAAPAGGRDGDIHFEANVAAGTMRVWHNYAGTWLHS